MYIKTLTVTFLFFLWTQTNQAISYSAIMYIILISPGGETEMQGTSERHERRLKGKEYEKNGTK